MDKKEIRKLCKQINHEFRPPFVPKGTVRATPYKNGKGFTLAIGGRDVDFNDKLGVDGAGTCLPL